MENRQFLVIESSANNFKFMCKNLGLKSTYWSVYFIENEIDFIMRREGSFRLYGNSEAGFKLLEAVRKAEGVIRFDVPLSSATNAALSRISNDLRVSRSAFVEFAIEFACYRLLGIKDKYAELKKTEVKPVFFLQHLASNKVSRDSHLEFYKTRLDFTSYRTHKDKRVNPVTIDNN